MRSLNRDKIRQYLDDCRDQEYSDATIHRFWMSIKAYCLFLNGEGRTNIIFDSDDGVKLPRRKELKLPSPDELEVMLNLPDVSCHFGLRDKAIMELIYSSGLRASELCDLLIGDVNIDTRQVRITSGKGDKARSVPVNSKAYELLKEWIGTGTHTPDQYVFYTQTGCRISRQYLGQIVTGYARKALLKDFTTHTLRHCCATHMIAQGADSAFIQKMLGHSSIMTTQYYMHLNADNLADMLNKYHPRESSKTITINEAINDNI